MCPVRSWGFGPIFRGLHHSKVPKFPEGEYPQDLVKWEDWEDRPTHIPEHMLPRKPPEPVDWERDPVTGNPLVWEEYKKEFLDPIPDPEIIDRDPTEEEVEAMVELIYHRMRLSRRLVVFRVACSNDMRLSREVRATGRNTDTPHPTCTPRPTKVYIPCADTSISRARRDSQHSRYMRGVRFYPKDGVERKVKKSKKKTTKGTWGKEADGREPLEGPMGPGSRKVGEQWPPIWTEDDIPLTLRHRTPSSGWRRKNTLFNTESRTNDAPSPPRERERESFARAAWRARLGVL